ncbi:MAG: hypothetical protein GY754_17870 [bacterium]|nr:hypothetical protein [bacterium]
MGTIDLVLLNCFIIIIPILIWNAVFASKLPEYMKQEVAGISRFVLIAEHVFRVPVFMFPLLIPLTHNTSLSQWGLMLASAGTIIYFLSWIPLLYFSRSEWTKKLFIRVAPAYTPLLPLAGIALIGHSWIYGIVCCIFILIHVYHETYRFTHSGKEALNV